MLSKYDLAYNQCEIKFTGSAGRFSGYASVFGGVDSYGDTIIRGAFAATVARERRPSMLFGHNPGRVIGKWTHLEEDARGLLVEGEFTPGHTDAQDVYASMKHGAINGLSIGFMIPEGGAEKKADGGRLIKVADVREISIVTMPADDEARVVAVKEHLESLTTLRDVETFLRDAGLSRSAAQTLLSRVKAILRSDSATGGGDGVKEQARRLAELVQQHGAMIGRLASR